MKFSIAHRLFLAILLSIVAVAAIALTLVRWQLFDSSSGRVTSAQTDRDELARVRDLGDVLAGQFRRRQDWSFLPRDNSLRKTWLGEALKAMPASTPGEAVSSNLGQRIGLLDRDEHLLAGATPNPAVIAFASIDTIRRPVAVDGHTVGYLVRASTQSPDGELAAAFLVQQQDNLMIALGVGVLLSALAAAALAAHFRRPIRALVAGAHRLEDGRFDTRLVARRSDELGALAEAFNHLAARLEDSERSRRQWVADTSHELRTPLSVLRAQLEALQDGIRAATPEHIATMLRQVLSLNRRIDELYELARADVGQLRYDLAANDLWPLVSDVAATFAEKIRAAGLVASIGPAPARSLVRCDAERMRQVFANLLENSVRYTAVGGRIDIAGAVVGDKLQVTIDDSAPGVPVAVMERLGERFFRIESSRAQAPNGAGLGLALCRQILEAHAGRVEFHASALGGLRVVIAVPLGSDA